MANNLKIHTNDMKLAVLSGESYNSVARRYGCDASQVIRLLKNDPDIVKAKAEGKLKKRTEAITAETALNDPAVADVLVHGMSVNAAAKKHGVNQPNLWYKVDRARKLLPEPVEPPTEETLAKVADKLRDTARKLGMTPEDLAFEMVRRLT